MQRRSPPCQRGVVWRSQTGGIPQDGRFPHRFVLSRSTSCESLSQKSKIFASSLWQGSLGVQWKTRGPLFSWLLWSSPAFSAVNHDCVKRPGRIFLPGFVSCFCCFFRRVQRRTGKTGTESGTGRGYSPPDSKGRKGLQATATERRGIPRGWSCSGWGSTAPE